MYNQQHGGGRAAARERRWASNVCAHSKYSISIVVVHSIEYSCCTTAIALYIRYAHILYCRTRYSHSSSYTDTPTMRRHWMPETCELKSPSLLFFVSAVQLYSVLLCNCAHMVGGWVVVGWRALLLYSCTASALAPTLARRPRSLGRSRRRSRAATIARACLGRCRPTLAVARSLAC